MLNNGRPKKNNRIAFCDSRPIKVIQQVNKCINQSTFQKPSIFYLLVKTFLTIY